MESDTFDRIVNLQSLHGIKEFVEFFNLTNKKFSSTGNWSINDVSTLFGPSEELTTAKYYIDTMNTLTNSSVSSCFIFIFLFFALSLFCFLLYFCFIFALSLSFFLCFLPFNCLA